MIGLVSLRSQSDVLNLLDQQDNHAFHTICELGQVTYSIRILVESPELFFQNDYGF